MPDATPSDVRTEIETHLGDSDISDKIARVSREIDREYDDDSSVSFADTQHRTDFEAALTALRIAEGADRRAETASSGGTSTTYETSEIENLRKRVRRDDPGNAFGHAGQIVRDTDRHTSTTTEH